VSAGRIYLDHGSTTPVLPEVVEVMRPFWLDAFGNPSSAHADGRRARRALEDARDTVAQLLQADPREVLFTSGATEANNLALFGQPQRAGGRMVASPVEHPSVMAPLEELRRSGQRLEFLPVNAEGLVPPDSLSSLVGPDLSLVAVMLANHETGAIQPVRDIALTCPGTVPFHCDATQAVGKIPVSFRQLGVSSLSLSAHKFNGPKGIGALLIRDGSAFRPSLHGGHQQHGKRPGTEPVPLAVGLAAALRIAVRDMADRRERVLRLRRLFLQRLSAAGTDFVVNGPLDNGLPHTLNLSFPGCPADVLLMKLDLVGVACSTGSACSSGSLLPSPVLQAMRVPDDLLKSAIRFSLSFLLEEEEVTEAAHRTSQAVTSLRTRLGLNN